MTQEQINVDLFDEVKKLKKEIHDLRVELRCAWLIMDDLENNDRADQWQNRNAEILFDE
jgi:hypothetical protein